MNPDNAKADVDWIEVSREAHELERRHGVSAHTFAARLAEEAEARGEFQAGRFWRAVSGALRPRG